MLSHILAEIVDSIVGDAIFAWLFPHNARPQPSPPEGEWNASLGSLAAFLASIAALLVLVAALRVFRGTTDGVMWLFVAASVPLALFAVVLARRALEVTQRRRVFARIALWLARATVVIGLIVAVSSIIGVT